LIVIKEENETLLYLLRRFLIESWRFQKITQHLIPVVEMLLPNYTEYMLVADLMLEGEREGLVVEQAMAAFLLMLAPLLLLVLD
jgi:hypothetical protein